MAATLNAGARHHNGRHPSTASSASIGPNHQNSTNSTSSARRGLSSPPSLLNARIFARLSAGYSSSAQEQKMAELRAAYASPKQSICSNTASTASATTTATAMTMANSNHQQQQRRSAPSRASLPGATNGGAVNGNVSDLFTTIAAAADGRNRTNGTSSTSSSRRGSAVANCLPTPSIMDMAASAGLLSLSPSDLVFESSVLGIAYYDFVLSVSEVTGAGSGGRSGSSCSSSTTATMKDRCGAAAEQQTPKMSSHSSPANKRRVCNTGSEPMAAPKADPEKGGPAGMLAFKLDKQRPGTSMGLGNAGAGRKVSSEASSSEASSGAEISSSAVVVPASLASSHASNASSNTFANCQYRLFLAKLDTHTNVEWFESVVVPGDLLERNGIPVNELSLLTMGILVWRSRLANSRLLCLVNGQLGDDSTNALEALKRAAGKYKCMHHVLTIGQRRQSASSTHSSCSTSSFRSSGSSSSHGQQGQQDAGMKLRVLMCQSRSELPELPAQALRDAKFLMAPSTNPLLCLCFPLT